MRAATSVFARMLERIVSTERMAIPLLFPFLFVVVCVRVGAGEEGQCSELRCSDHGPAIRFPFSLTQQHPDQCGYPGFNLSCNPNNETVLELPSSVQVLVSKINYTSRTIRIYAGPHSCLPWQLPKLNLSASAFQFSDEYRLDYVLFNCSAPYRDIGSLVGCLGVPGYQVYAVSSHSTISDDPSFISCMKIDISVISSVPEYIFEPNFELQLNWSDNSYCSKCIEHDKTCKLKNSTTEPGIECLEKLKKNKDTSTPRLIIGLVLGLPCLVLLMILLYRAYSRNKADKESQAKIEKFLEDYKALKATRYSYDDIKKITSQFRDELGRGAYGTVFKGKLSNEILVAVKILNNSIGKGEEFINEVGTIGRIHHVNVVRLVGFCADGFKRALVYEFMPNDSLEKSLSSENRNRNFLGWEKLQDIALGIAKGIEYLHQGCDQRILHFDIKLHNVLLDHNFIPKISDFGLAKLCSKDKSAISMTAARGTVGYIAPEVFSRNFGNVSYKSDVYSFGMLLLEMVGVRKKSDANAGEAYFPEWIYDHLAQEEVLGMHIEVEEHAKIAKKLTIVGLWCIQWYPVDRPAIKTVVQMLEGDVDSLTLPPNPFASTAEGKSSTKTARAFDIELEAISESE